MELRQHEKRRNLCGSLQLDPLYKRKKEQEMWKIVDNYRKDTKEEIVCNDGEMLITRRTYFLTEKCEKKGVIGNVELMKV